MGWIIRPIGMIMKCPICESNQVETLTTLKGGTFDKSLLYSDCILEVCNNCGHVFNNLNEQDELKMNKYYNDESFVCNQQHPSKVGDFPGSSNNNSLIRYSTLYSFQKNYLKESHKVLDVGCALGGYLSHLKGEGLTNLHGIDFSINCVN